MLCWKAVEAELSMPLVLHPQNMRTGPQISQQPIERPNIVTALNNFLHLTSMSIPQEKERLKKSCIILLNMFNTFPVRWVEGLGRRMIGRVCNRFIPHQFSIRSQKTASAQTSTSMPSSSSFGR